MSLSIPKQSNSVGDNLMCPVGKILSDVLLSPCTHRVNEVVAKSMYGDMISEEQGVSKKGKKCTVCQKKVTHYYILTSLLDKPQQALSPQVSAPTQADVKEKAAGDFPGKAAKFEWDSGDWQTSYDCDLVKYIRFKCVTTVTDPLFTQFSILGHQDGSVAITLEWKKNVPELPTYFSTLGIQVNKEDYFVCASRFESEQAKKIFAVLAKHNEIPDSHLGFIRNLIEAGDWRKVPTDNNEKRVSESVQSSKS